MKFDGRYLTNHKDLFGLTLDEGKKLVIGSTMTMGQADNECNIVEIPPWSLYRFSANMIDLEWHGICRVLKRNRTIMFRNAVVSLNNV